jgi:hypothetical protein
VSTAHVVLVVVGWPVETLGVLLVAAPDWVPPTRRSLVRGWSQVRRILRRPTVIHLGKATSESRSYGVAIASVSMPDYAPLDERVAFLMERVKLLQQRVGRVESEVGEGLERRWTDAIEASAREMRGEVATGLAHLRGEYLRVRQVGLGLLIVGGAMLAAANLVA